MQRSVPSVLASFTSLATCLTAETLAIKTLFLLFFWVPIRLVNISNSSTSHLQAIIHDSLYNLGVRDKGMIRLR